MLQDGRISKSSICNVSRKILTCMEEVKLFIIFETEFVNETTGQVVTLTTTCGSYKELGRYLTDMGKKKWRMLKVARKES